MTTVAAAAAAAAVVGISLVTFGWYCEEVTVDNTLLACFVPVGPLSNFI